MAKDAMLAALNLEMPPVIPRTEFSAETHWPLVQAVTGLKVSHDSPSDVRFNASKAFIRAWDYSMIWNTNIGRDIFGEHITDMGHAVYADGGVDYREIGKPLIDDPEDVYSYNLFDVHGTPDVSAIVRRFNENYARQEANFPTCVNMVGIYETCISGILDILGWDMLLLAAGVDKEAFGQFVNHYASWIKYYFEALAECDAPVVMVHDDFVWANGGFLSPEFYREFVFPNYKKYFDPIKEAGKKILFTSDGNFTQYIDDVAKCGVDGFVLEPLTDMKVLAEKYGKTHVFIGNADTAKLLYGSREQIEEEVRRCIDIGHDCPGFVMAVGNHIPSNTPVDSCLWYNECVQKYSRR